MRLVIPVPSRYNNTYTSTGDYEIKLSVFDLDSNLTSYADTFEVKSDVKLPYFSNLTTSLAKAPAGSGATFLACPQKPVKFNGFVGDNTKLRRVGFRYTSSGDASYPVNTNAFEYDRVDVGRYLNDSLQIIFPASLSESVVTLTIFAEDVFRNRKDTTFSVLVSCDATAPTIVLEDANKMPINGVAYLPQGLDYEIRSLRIADDRALREAKVFLGTSAQNLALQQSFPLNNIAQTTLSGIKFDQGKFVVGQRYFVRIEATDTSNAVLQGGNKASLSFEIQSVADMAPDILAVNFIVNEGKSAEQQLLSPIAGEEINLGKLIGNGLSNILYIGAKGEDDIGIANLQMRWRRPNGSTSMMVNRSFSPVLPVLKVSDYYTNGTFVFSEAGVYALELILRDTKGQENGGNSTAPFRPYRTYYFRVE
jgi:hypothetical protein